VLDLGENMMKPTVGSMVHFYDHTGNGRLGGAHPGPHPAVVTRTYGDDREERRGMVDLFVMVVAMPPFHVLSVKPDLMPPINEGFYWTAANLRA
jgi:hypothetical protein